MEQVSLARRLAIAALILFGTAAGLQAVTPYPITPFPLCPEDPCRIVIGEKVYCAEPDYFCNEPSDASLNAVATPHAWTEADLDIFIAALKEGDTNGDIPGWAFDDLRSLIESGGTINDISGWFQTWFDPGLGFTEDGDPGDRISAAACKQACRRIPGILPSQCKKVCKRVSKATRVGFKSLCEHMERHRESGWKLCWQIYGVLWPSEEFLFPEIEPVKP